MAAMSLLLPTEFSLSTKLQEFSPCQHFGGGTNGADHNRRKIEKAVALRPAAVTKFIFRLGSSVSPGIKPAHKVNLRTSALHSAESLLQTSRKSSSFAENKSSELIQSSFLVSPITSTRRWLTRPRQHFQRSSQSTRPNLNRRSGKARAKAEGVSEAAEEEGGMNMLGWRLTAQQVKVASAAALTTILALANRILYKMALVPLKEYPFFLAQLTTFGYVGVYFTILLLRYRAGIVTNEMLSLPKGRFALMGVLEALGLATGMAAAAKLPGALISILSQTYLVWQLALSSVILGKRYTPTQILGCLLVMAGVAIVVASGSGAGSALASTGLWPLLLIASTAFPAGATILKESVFKDAAQRLQGGNVDLFVVNSFGSGFQALFVVLLLPLLSSLRGIPLAQLPTYFGEGSKCLLNFGATGTGCEGAPLVPLLYVVANLAFNISALNLLKSSSAIVASLTLTLVVPLTVVAFTLPLPLLGEPAPLPPGFGLGVGVLVTGLALYNIMGAKSKPETKKA